MSKSSKINNIAVIGAGTMGHGIAQLCASKGFKVVLIDQNKEALDKAFSKISASLDKFVSKNKISLAQKAQTLENIVLRDSLDFMSPDNQPDLIIEAIVEKPEAKQKLFESFENYNGLVATNTSCLSVSKLAESIKSPKNFIGLHFFNPPPIMKLLEIVVGEKTSEQASKTAQEFAKALGKESIVVKDSPGFATSRLGLALGVEAMRMVESGVASAKDIDTAMKLGYGHPMGPLELTDLIGLDVRLNILENLHQELGSETFKPPEILIDLVRDNKLGKKTSFGFYEY